MTDQIRTWSPTVGKQMHRLAQRMPLSEGEANDVTRYAQRILGRCINPSNWNRLEKTAELVVGEVQSGKTLSFTALTALARDNGFPLIIILAGTKKNLMRQTVDRLKEELAMGGDGSLPDWRLVSDINVSRESMSISRLIKDWGEHRNPEWTPATTVVVAMKNSSGLRKCTSLLQSIHDSCGSFPVLIIDDEGDQAGLNLFAKNSRGAKESATYRSIRNLRDTVALHSYVLYTATPQALLLIKLSDMLSARSVTVLPSGIGYVGGRELFVDREDDFARPINDIEEALNPEELSPPKTLQTALATFLIALVVGQQRNTRPLSMLIHPSATQDLHGTYEKWVHDVLFRRVEPALKANDPELTEELLANFFRPAYEDLRRTGGTFVGDKEMSLENIASSLPRYLSDLQIRIVNGEEGNEVSPDEWKSHTGWIVIGGAKLDRGFTVEKLAVTYMPRGTGVGNADTIQQRGRFFGYKREYVDLLRAWLNPEMTSAYRNYVEHEASLRSQLSYYDVHNISLRNWSRQFVLDPSLRPTRKEVITIDLLPVSLSPGWHLRQDRLYIPSVGLNDSKIHLLRSLLESATPHPDDFRTTVHHTVIRAPWGKVSPFIRSWGAAPEERSRLDALLFSDHSEYVEIVFIDNLRPRLRSLRNDIQIPDAPNNLTHFAETASINQLFQGESGRYPGDKEFTSPTEMTIQVHCVQPEKVGNLGGAPVLALAVHLPSEGPSVLREVSQ